MSAEAELEEYETVLRNATGKPSADVISKYLKLVRELRVRDSETVARYGAILLRNYKSRLSEEELWLVHEQVAVAALDCSALPLGASLIRALTKRFPESIRVKRLQGMYWEAVGQLDRAEEVYKDALATEPHNAVITKRLVALEKSRGNTSGAIDALKKVVDVYPNDREAWEELAECYLELLMFKQAAFCYEDLIMAAPGNPHYLVRYADTLYTMGGSSNLKAARSYYSKAIELSGGSSLRALYGVLACTTNLPEKVALQDSRSRAQIELPEWAALALAGQYKEGAPDKLPLVTALLKGQGLA